MSDDFFSVDRGVIADPIRFQEPLMLTPEVFVEICEKMLADHGGPRREYHSPTCPKILTQGERACRCGAAPTEAIFEDTFSLVVHTTRSGRTWFRLKVRPRRRKAGTKERTRKRR